MPIYEYECTKCGDEFEVLQSFSDKPLKKCKKCKGRLHKKVSQSAFHLKGSGWYVTDYGKGNGGPSTALAKKEDSPPPPPKKSEASDAKTAKKASESS